MAARQETQRRGGTGTAAPSRIQPARRDVEGGVERTGPVEHGRLGRAALDHARLSDALRESERHLRMVVQNAPVILFALDREGRFILSEGRGLESLGQQPGQLVGASAFEVHRERPEIVRSIRAAMAGETTTSLSTLYGVTFETHWMPFSDDSGASAGVIGVAVDITERTHAEEALRRASRALAAKSASHHALMRATSESELLSGVCRAIADAGGYRLAWVGYPEHDAAKTVRPVAQHGDTGYLARIYVSWADTPEGRGPIGTAFRTRLPYVVQYIRTAPSFAPWRDVALAYGYEATLALPLLSAGQVIGVLGIYAAEANAFDVEETQRLNELAGDLAYGITALRTRAEHARVVEALRANEERYRRIVEAAQEGIWEADAAGRTVYVNPRMADLLGYRAEEMRGVPVSAFMEPDERAAARKRLERRQCGETVAEHYEVRLRRKDGTTLWALIAATVLTDEIGRFAGTIALINDITERKKAEEAHARLAAIVESSNDAIIGWTLEGTITSWNPGAEGLYGYTAEEIVGRPISTLIPPDRSDELPVITDHLRRGERIANFETVRRHKDGRTLDVLLSIAPVRDTAGAVIGIAAIARDIGERKRAEEALRHQALHDALTSLPNRTLLHDRLEQAIRAAARGPAPLALLLFDLDRFKEVNDTFGHHHGDLLLRQVAERLRGLVRGADTVARLGGDEFAVVLPGDDEAGAVTTATKIAAALDEPFLIEGQSVHIGASIGIALCPTHGLDAGTLLRRADVAMYAAKQERHAHAVYSAAQDTYTPDRLARVDELRRAIALGQLTLHYQPKLALDTRELVGVEALVRWPHPRLGLIPPDQFVPLAEQTGQIGALTAWVLEAALRQCRAWQRQGVRVPVAVNLSAANLHDPQLPETVARLLRAQRVPGTLLRIEVTEGTLMADPARARDVLERLAALGVGISVDDYGAGYSSLAYLKRLPVDEMKIDKSFVQHMADDDTDAAIVASTIGLGHSLGLRVVAEGVENTRAWEALTAMGCDVAQGYYISPPLPAPAMKRWLHEAWGAA